MLNKVTVLFIADTDPKTGAIHKKGDTQEMTPESAQRWFRREVAIIAPEQKAVSSKKKTAAQKK